MRKKEVRNLIARSTIKSKPLTLWKTQMNMAFSPSRFERV
jgi:hypothetical protein